MNLQLMLGTIKARNLPGIVPKNTVASTSHGKAVEKLVSKRLALSNGGETTRLNLSSVERNGVRREAETVSNQAGELCHV